MLICNAALIQRVIERATTALILTVLYGGGYIGIGKWLRHIVWAARALHRWHRLSPLLLLLLFLLISPHLNDLSEEEQTLVDVLALLDPVLDTVLLVLLVKVSSGVVLMVGFFEVAAEFLRAGEVHEVKDCLGHLTAHQCLAIELLVVFNFSDWLNPQAKDSMWATALMIEFSLCVVSIQLASVYQVQYVRKRMYWLFLEPPNKELLRPTILNDLQTLMHVRLISQQVIHLLIVNLEVGAP